MDFTVSDDARDFITLVQQSQDTGMAWVDCFNNNLPHFMQDDRLGTVNDILYFSYFKFYYNIYYSYKE